MYLHEFDSNKVFNKKGLKSKSGSEKRISFSKTQKNPKIMISQILNKMMKIKLIMKKKIIIKK